MQLRLTWLRLTWRVQTGEGYRCMGVGTSLGRFGISILINMQTTQCIHGNNLRITDLNSQRCSQSSSFVPQQYVHFCFHSPWYQEQSPESWCRQCSAVQCSAVQCSAVQCSGPARGVTNPITAGTTFCPQMPRVSEDPPFGRIVPPDSYFQPNLVLLICLHSRHPNTKQ
jgi:hypothetical protein